MPGICHLLPVRNGEMYIERALFMMYRNCQVDDEILIIDDGSLDNTPKILKAFSYKTPNLRFIRVNQLGLVKSLNLGFSESSKNWIARYDVDDIYPSNRIKLQRGLISEKVAAIFSDYEMTLESGLKMGNFPSPITESATYLSLIRSQQTAHSSALVNRSFFNAVGGYKQDDFPAEDLGLWLRLGKVGSLISVPRTLMRYQLSNSSTSGSRRKLVLEKRSQLLSEHFDLDIITHGDDQELILRTMEIYSGTANEALRKLFFLRNLIAVSTGNYWRLAKPKQFFEYSIKALFQEPTSLANDLKLKLYRVVYRKFG